MLNYALYIILNVMLHASHDDPEKAKFVELLFVSLGHYSFSRSKYFPLMIAPIEGFITLIG